MQDRADTALSVLRAKLVEFEAVVLETSDPDWDRVAAAERWPVAVVAFHIARGFQRQAEFIEAARHGFGPHLFTWDETDALNARVAAAHSSPSRDEVLTLARTS